MNRNFYMVKSKYLKYIQLLLFPMKNDIFHNDSIG